MNQPNEPTDLDIAALISSKICHDVIGPVGAIYNGLEILDEDEDVNAKNYALNVIRNVTEQASARLQFARFAFGAAGSAGAMIDLTTAEQISRGFIGQGKHRLSWHGLGGHMAKDKVKLLLNLVASSVTALPRDTSFADFMGNGQWNCAGYWSKNHTAAAPTVTADGTAGVCGNTTTTTLSRYDVYRYEIAQNLINDWSGNRQPNLKSSDHGTGESGKPYCAGANTGVDETNGFTDRRLIPVPIINCLANGPFPPGFNATEVPVATFGNFFMTQPIGVDGDNTNPVYGELVGQTTAKQADIYVPIQLYR